MLCSRHTAVLERDILVQHLFWALAVVVAAGYLIVQILRKRRMRRRQPQFHIPDFLSGRPPAGDNAGSVGKTDWLEIRPLPKRFRKD